MNIVENKFLNKSIGKGGLLLFSKQDTLLFIEECQKENISILGIDGFLLLEEKTQPSIENSIDFSSPKYVSKTKNTFLDAIDFINQRNENIFFEIICSA